MAPSNWFLYLIETASGNLYTGITTDVNRRFEEHLSGTGSKYLRGKGPLKLVFQQPVSNRSIASQLEARVKKLSKKDKLKLLDQPERLSDLLAALSSEESNSS